MPGSATAPPLPHSSILAPQDPDTVVLSQWILAQQYTDARRSASYGALKVAPGVAATGADGRAYYRVSPYLADLALVGPLRRNGAGAREAAERWITWYFSHLDARDAPDGVPDGVPDEHFYLADGSGETTCVKEGDAHLCHYNDATDSAAATFFSLLLAYREAGGRLTPNLKPILESLAATLLALQQPDGLCWAKVSYHAQYLEDNCEVFDGLRALAEVERRVFRDDARAAFYEQAAARVKTALLGEMWDAEQGRFYVARFDNGKRDAADVNRWYPDMPSQFWPVLFGVVAADDPRARAALEALNARWNGVDHPDWAGHPELVNGGWINADVAYGALLCGDTARVQTYRDAVRRLKFPTNGQAGFSWPFTVADAGWLLRF